MIRKNWKSFLACLLVGGLFMGQGFLMSWHPGTQEGAYAVTTSSEKPMQTVPALLKVSWQGYKAKYIQADGRVLDPNAQYISTSEGQSYALLRAVWMNDQATFKSLFQWTQNNLQVRGDHLFAWKWGRHADGTWAELEKVSASDADQDIALALLMADRRWPGTAYKQEALAILNDLWEKSVLKTRSKQLVMLAGDWGKSQSTVILNPSYWAPYAYRIFAEVDKAHDWNRLVDSSYDLLDTVTSQTRSGLPPDWVTLNTGGKGRSTSALVLFEPEKDNRSDYGYDAIRVYWRVGLDYLLNPSERRAHKVLTGTHYLARYWRVRKRLPTRPTIEGFERSPHVDNPSRAVYGAALLALAVQDPTVAKEVFNEQILPALNTTDGLWDPWQDYYAQNLLWFGLAAYDAYQRQGQSKNRETDQLSKLVNLVSL